MVLPELGPGIWMGIGFGIVGISVWIVGLWLFNRLVQRMEEAEPPHDR